MSEIKVNKTVAEVVAMPAGDADNPAWINPGVTAVVRTLTEKKMKSGKTYWQTTLADATGPATIDCSFFNPPNFNEGDLINLNGQGLRRTEYNGKPQITISAKTVVERAGKSVHHAEQVQAAAELKPAVNGEPQSIPGVTAGMAVKEALEWKRATINPNASQPNQPLFWQEVWEFASDTVRVARMIETGKLAEAVKNRGEDVPY